MLASCTILKPQEVNKAIDGVLSSLIVAYMTGVSTRVRTPSNIFLAKPSRLKASCTTRCLISVRRKFHLCAATEPNTNPW